MIASKVARTEFRRVFGVHPAGVAFAPGRVNLIGEHVDYNDGLVLPMPIEVGTYVAWRPISEPRLDLVALDAGQERVSLSLDGLSERRRDHWTTYVLGMAVSMQRRGLPVRGAELLILGDMPRGAGLSSSASLCIAVGRALAASTRAPMPTDRVMALAAQDTEHHFAGVNCGIMDQMAIACGRSGEALLLDCRDLSMRPVTLPPGWSVMIVQSGVRRGLVEGHYNERRGECEAAVTALGGRSLRDADLASVRTVALPLNVERRATHVIEEIARVRDAVTAMKSSDIERFGELMAASHASLRDLFEVSVPPVDHLVAVLQSAIGARGGARMTGGGFGGAVVAVAPRDAMTEIAADLTLRYRTPSGGPPDIMIDSVAFGPP